MRALQKELSAPGEITIGTILQAPGVMRAPEEAIKPEEAWGPVERALRAALADLIKMREREGKHLAKDLIHRLKAMRKTLKEVRAAHPEVVKKLPRRVAGTNRESRIANYGGGRAPGQGSHFLPTAPTSRKS